MLTSLRQVTTITAGREEMHRIRAMSPEMWLKSFLEYGCDLMVAAVEGARAAEPEIFEGQSPRSVLMRSARTSLAPGATALSLGLLTAYWVSKRRSVPDAVAFGVAGAVVGFAGGMAWSTRRLTGGMARGALKNINATRDAHWLAHNPVDYA
jgi:hypothetical protein